MILAEIPRDKSFFEVVVIPCFTEGGRAILLRKRLNHPIYPGLWGFPAGKVRMGAESILEAAQREIFEEIGNKISTSQIEEVGLSVPTMHTKFSGESFYFVAHFLSLKDGQYLKEVIINPKEHSSYKLEASDNIFSIQNGNMIPDAQETFRKFCEIKGIIKAT